MLNTTASKGTAQMLRREIRFFTYFMESDNDMDFFISLVGVARL